MDIKNKMKGAGSDMNHITKISGLMFDVTRFHLGWTYIITSDYFENDEAICSGVCMGQLEFLIKNDEGTYDKITLTPNLVGSGRYRFQHRIDKEMVDVHSLTVRKCV